MPFLLVYSVYRQIKAQGGGVTPPQSHPADVEQSQSWDLVVLTLSPLLIPCLATFLLFIYFY